MAERSLELKVGAFLLLAVAILVGFLFILGDFDFTEGHKVAIDFRTSGGLRDGAKVKIAGVKAGSIEAIEFLGGEETTKDGERVFVRVRIELDPEMARTVTRGSTFRVSTEGLLGERYVEITPGPTDAEPIPAGAVVAGETPVDIQEVSNQAAQMLAEMQETLQGEKGSLSATMKSLRTAAERIDRVTAALDEKLPSLIDDSQATMESVRSSLANIDTIVEDARTLMARKEGISDAVTKVNGMLTRLDEEIPELVDSSGALLADSRTLIAESRETLDALESEVTATAADTRKLLATANRTVAALDLEGTAKELRLAVTRLVDGFGRTSEQVGGIAQRVGELVTDVGVITQDLREGKGTLGALLRERELYDDIREMVLELKRHPWKVVWKP